ncbi:MAG: MFS transporter [Polyangiaceae bacterium]
MSNPVPETDPSAAATPAQRARAVQLAVLVAALGYFVDIYDLLLFSVVRIPSVKALGVDPNDGAWILSAQMLGLLGGGILWGVLGDKRGRLSVLFGSILLYSLANIANGFVQDIHTYGALRFIAGVGLAGELGAGITLVSESMSKEKRGYGTMVVATVGIGGAILAVAIAKTFEWRTAYFVGGGMGLALLLLRVGVYESGMFQSTRKREVSRGNFLQLFWPMSRLRRYFAIVLVGVPIWYVIGLLISRADVFGVALGLPKAPDPAYAVLFAYSALVLGDFSCGGLSQILKSRRRALAIYLGFTVIATLLYFTLGGRSASMFYAMCALVGFGAGYWAVFVTVASEQFGTNLRATATTTAPNFVRGSVSLQMAIFDGTRGSIGPVMSGALIGAGVFFIAFAALGMIGETHGRDLDFLED